MKETNNSAQAANSSVNATTQSNYSQQHSVGMDATGQAIEASLINGFPYYRILIPHSKPTPYQKFVETIDGKTDAKFKAIAAIPALCFNGTIAYVIVLTDKGQVGLLYQETTNLTWRWYGLMPNKAVYFGYFNWIAVNTGFNGNAQVVLINETGTPALLSQDNSSGNWTWDWLPPNYSITPPNYALHLSTVQLGRGYVGDLQAVFTGQDGLAYVIRQDNNTGSWAFYERLPGDSNTNFTLVQIDNSYNNNLQCVFQSMNNQLYLIWLNSSTGEWSWYGRLPIASEVGNKPIISYLLRKSNQTLNLFIVYESSDPGLYDVYKILQDAKGVWTWQGLFTTTNKPYPS